MSRHAVIYLLSGALSLLGNSVISIALPLLVLLRTGSALGAGTVMLASALPAVLIGIIGGVILDRVNRRTVSIYSDVISAVAVAAIPIVDGLFGLSLGWFVALGVIGAIGDVPGMTARETLLPAVVARSGVSSERLVGLRESLGALVMVIGPALAGGLMVWLEGSTVMWFTAATSASAALVTLMLPRDIGRIAGTSTEPGAEQDRSPVALAVAQLREGLDHLFRRDSFILALTLMMVVFAGVFGAFQALLLPVHFAALGQPGRLGLVLSALSVGMLVGAGTYAVVGQKASRRTWFTLALLASAVFILFIAALPAYALLLTGAFAVGLAAGPLNAVLGVLAIERIPEALRGRIMGTQNSVVMLIVPLVVFAAALGIERVGLRPVAWALGALWVVASLVWLRLPALRDLEPRGADQDVEAPESDEEQAA
ncbi:MAG: MFS transporter [Trueperaceae bacterium]|nr:MFS transporter [Trueperaceae bacterium]